jgi:hypothetical protein
MVQIRNVGSDSMKTMSAREAKNGFGLMINTACGAGADRKAQARCWSSRWKSMNGLACNLDARRGPRGRRKAANEAFAGVKMDQLLKDADRSLTDGHSVRFEYFKTQGEVAAADGILS